MDRARWVMGTALEIAAHGPGAAAAVMAAFAEVERLDRVLSIHKDDSEASALNRRAHREPFPCSPALWEAIELSRLYHQLSRGAYDPTVLPQPNAIFDDGNLPGVGFGKLLLDPRRRTVKFPKYGMRLDFGGIGKGLALDKAAAALRAGGVRSALLNFGGQVYALGTEPGRGGWLVKVPGGPDLYLKDASASTSGNSERPGHILSPFTGAPVLGRPPVTVVASGGAEADAWSTALFVEPEAPFKGCWISAGGKRITEGCKKYLATEFMGESK